MSGVRRSADTLLFQEGRGSAARSEKNREAQKYGEAHWVFQESSEASALGCEGLG